MMRCDGCTVVSDKGNSASNMRSPVLIPDADDSGFSELGGAGEGSDARAGRRKSNVEDVPAEAVFWETPFLGSSTPYQGDRFSGDVTLSRWDNSSSTLDGSAEILHIDLRHRSSSCTCAVTGVDTVPRKTMTSHDFMPWSFESRYTSPLQQNSRFRNVSFCPEPRECSQRKGDKSSGGAVASGINAVEVPVSYGSSPTHQNTCPVGERMPCSVRRLVKGDSEIRSINRQSGWTNELPNFKKQSDCSVDEKSSRSPLAVGDCQTNGSNTDIAESTDSKVITEMNDSGLYYLRQSVQASGDTYEAKPSRECLDLNDRSSRVYFPPIKSCHRIQKNILNVGVRSIGVGNHFHNSYKNEYSDVSDEEPVKPENINLNESSDIDKQDNNLNESLDTSKSENIKLFESSDKYKPENINFNESSDIDKQEKTHLTDASDTDSTTEKASITFFSSPESTTRKRGIEEHIPRMKVRRKMARPRRSAEPKDPRFRGITMWLQTEFKEGQSKLHISAFYSNVKPRCHKATKTHTCHQGPSASDLHSCSDNESNSLYNYVKICASCRTRRTPLWRDAEDGTPLCNACGIRYKKYRLRCSKCWHIPKKEIKTYPNCPICGASLRYSFHSRKAW